MGYHQAPHRSTPHILKVSWIVWKVYVHNGCISKNVWDANSVTDTQKAEAQEMEWAVVFIKMLILSIKHNTTQFIHIRSL
jgi:hypothetical protein